MLKKLALLAYVLSELKQINGKKALQKIIYFVSDKLSIDYHYRMYWYGPFSKELAELLDYLLIQKVVAFETKNNRVKILFVDSEKSRRLVDDLKKNFSQKELEEIKNLLEKLSKFSPRELELMATIDFVKKTVEINSIKDEIEVIRNLKGKKFSETEILRAIQLLSEIYK